MIGLEGGWTIKFTVNKLIDFMKFNDLVEFTILEESGNILPKFQLSFQYDTDIGQYLNEGNSLKFSYGKKIDDLKDSELIISKAEHSGAGTKYTYVLSGFINSRDYLSNKLYSIQRGNTADIISTIANKHFTVVSNVTSNDNQVWIQPTISDKAFVNHMLMRSNTKGIPFIGITYDKKFIFKDLIKDVTNKPSWILSLSSEKTNALKYNKDFTIIDNTGFNNSWQGYGKLRPYHNLLDGTYNNYTIAQKSVLSNSSSLNRRSSSTSEKELGFTQSDNMHTNYWKSFQTNMINMSMMTNIKVEIDLDNDNSGVTLLDQVMLMDSENNKQESIELYSGKYYIGRIIRRLQNGKFDTMIDIYRDYFNVLTGTFK